MELLTNCGTETGVQGMATAANITKSEKSDTKFANSDFLHQWLGLSVTVRVRVRVREREWVFHTFLFFLILRWHATLYFQGQQTWNPS